VPVQQRQNTRPFAGIGDENMACGLWREATTPNQQGGFRQSFRLRHKGLSCRIQFAGATSGEEAANGQRPCRQFAFAQSGIHLRREATPQLWLDHVV